MHMMNDYHISMIMIVIGVLFLATAVRNARRFHQSLQRGTKEAIALPFDRFLRVSRVVMVFTIAGMILGYWIHPFVPCQLRGLHLWLLVSCCFLYVTVTYYRAIRRLLRLLDLRRVATAAREWAAVQACILFDSFTILMAWLVTNILLALSSVNLLDPTGVIATFGNIGRKWLPDICMGLGARVGHMLSLAYDNAPQLKFLTLFLGVSLIICVTQLLLRLCWEQVRDTFRRDRISQSPDYLIVTSFSLLIVATGAYLLFLYPFAVIGLDNGSALKPNTSVDGVYGFGIVVAAILGIYSIVSFIRRLCQPFTAAGTTNQKSRREVITRVVVTVGCMVIVVVSASSWLKIAYLGTTLRNLQRTFVPDGFQEHSQCKRASISNICHGISGSLLREDVSFQCASAGVVSLAALSADQAADPERWQKDLLEKTEKGRDHYNNGMKPIEFNMHPYLRIAALAALAWLLALFTMGTYVLPHSFSQDMNRSGDTTSSDRGIREISSQARIKCGLFLSQCLVGHSVSVVAGGVLHLGASLLPVMCAASYFGLQVPAYTPSLTALWFTSLPMLMGPLLVAYLGQKDHFNKDASRRIGVRIQNHIRDHAVIIGAGNLGQTILAKKMQSMIEGLSVSLSKSFLIIVDNDCIPQPVNMQVVLIDKSSDDFAHVFDPDSRFGVGCVRLSRQLLENASCPISSLRCRDSGKTSLHDQDACSMPSGAGLEPLHNADNRNILFPAVRGNASSGDVMDAVRWRNASSVVVAMNDDSASLCLYNYLCERRLNDTPGIVMKLDSGSLFRKLIKNRFMMGRHPKVILLYPPPDEAENLVRYINVRCEPNNASLDARHFLIVGGGRRVAHVLRALIAEFGVDDPKTWIPKHVSLLTSDKFIKESLCLSTECPNMRCNDETERCQSALRKSSVARHDQCWKLYIARLSSSQNPICFPVKYVPRVEYSALRAVLCDLVRTHEQKRIDVVAFADQDESLSAVVVDVASDLACLYRKQISICMSVLASHAFKTLDEAENLPVNKSIPIKRVVHDEVIAAEMSSCLDIMSHHSDVYEDGERISLHICEKDIAGILLWKALVLGGMCPDDATKEVKAVIESFVARDIKVPSWHYYFTESGLSLADERGGIDRGYRFRSSFSMQEAVWRGEETEGRGEEIENPIINVSAVNWTKGVLVPEGGVWARSLLLGKDRSTLEMCSTLCPCVISRDMNHCDAKSKTEEIRPFIPSSGSIDVVCDGYRDVGSFARMLGTLMLQDWSTRKFRLPPVGVKQPVMDIRFIKSNEFCGPPRTLCTIHGCEVRPESSRLNINSSSKKLPGIIRIEMEGDDHEVVKYWKALSGMFREKWPDKFDVGNESRMIIQRLGETMKRSERC